MADDCYHHTFDIYITLKWVGDKPALQTVDLLQINVHNHIYLTDIEW